MQLVAGRQPGRRPPLARQRPARGGLRPRLRRSVRPGRLGRRHADGTPRRALVRPVRGGLRRPAPAARHGGPGLADGARHAPPGGPATTDALVSAHAVRRRQRPARRLRDAYGHRLELDSRILSANPFLWHELDTGVRRSLEKGTLLQGEDVLRRLAEQIDGETAQAVLRASGLSERGRRGDPAPVQGLNAARGGSSTVRTPWFRRSGFSARRGGSSAGSAACPSIRCADPRNRLPRREAP